MSAFYDLLAEASDGKVRADHALSRPGQLVYLPNRGDAYEHRIVAGAFCVLDPSHRVIQRRESTQRALKAAEAEARAARAVKAGETPSGERSVISDFNERTPVGEMLARCGYEPSGHDWRSPNQGSGSFATRDRGDHWVSLSTSDAEVGLGLRTKNGHRTGDAFDLFVHYEHNGDFTSAVRAHGDVMAGLGVGHPSAAEEFGEAVADAPATAVDDGVQVFSAASLSGLALPERRAIDKLHMIPMNVVTGFSGDGGTGKSQMAMQLGCGVAHTGSWLGIAVERGPVLYFSAEDDRAENHIRLSQIAAAEGFAIGDLVDLHLIDMAGRDAVLATEDARNGRMLETPLFKQICTHIDRIRPVLLVLDNLADVFSGNESNRTLVRQFVGMLRGIGHKFGCAVLLLSHPSLAGLTSGSGNSGSTAWHNSFRSRLYLRRELDEKGFERNSRRRVLEHKKANYAGSGMLLTLEWDAGRFTPLDGLNELDGTFDAEARTRRAERVFLDLVELHWMNKVNVSIATGPNFAPFVFADHALSEGITKREFKAAMDALLGRGAIQIHESGPPSRRTRTIISAMEAAL